MNGMSLKEKAVLAVIGVIFLYGAAAVLWFVSQKEAWRKATRAYELACTNYAKECKLISEKKHWTDMYEDEKSLMPMFAFGKDVDTQWLQKTDEIAARNFIQIASRQNGKEVSAGEVLELPITGNGWEGSLDSLVKFMYELETTSEGMFDISAINFKPGSKKGFLKGNFTLTCAYMRE